MSSKRKPTGVPEAGRAAGKRRMEQSDVDESADIVGDDLEGLIGDDGLDAVNDAIAEANGDALDAGLSDDDGDDDADLEAALKLGAESVQDSEAESEVLDEELPFDEEELKTATELDFSETSISKGQARAIAELLASNAELTVIHFEGHDLNISELREEDELEWDSEEFTDVEAIIIAVLLRSNTTVMRLDLARNQIADAGAIALADMLAQNCTLEYLNLESNVVAEKGGVALCDAIQRNSSLQYLNLMYNAFPGSVQQKLRTTWTDSREGSALGLHL